VRKQCAVKQTPSVRSHVLETVTACSLQPSAILNALGCNWREDFQFGYSDSGITVNGAYSLWSLYWKTSQAATRIVTSNGKWNLNVWKKKEEERKAFNFTCYLRIQQTGTAHSFESSAMGWKTVVHRPQEPGCGLSPTRLDRSGAAPALYSVNIGDLFWR
jgi:hypothetical protein